FDTGRTAGDIITITRDTPADRENLYTNTNFVPAMLNQDFGIQTLIEQQNQLFSQGLCLRYNTSCSFTDDALSSIDLILPILEANQFWVKNASNDGFAVAELDNAGLPASGPFILYQVDATLPNGISLGSLTDGILAQTVSSGISTPYIINLPLTTDIGGT